MSQVIQLRLGDCIERMAEMEEGSIAAICGDPPYGLRFMNKKWDDLDAHQAEGMGQREWHRRWLVQAFRVLQPGGVLKAFGGTRTFHHLAKAMEEIGFERIGLISWTYGSGFPKSLNISKSLDKMAGAQREMKRITYRGNEVYRMDGDNTRPWMEEARKKGYHELPGDEPVTEEAKIWRSWGSGLKPAWEPIVVGYKPLA